VWVSALRLTDFRSYENVSLDLPPGVVTFVGQNGQGKTNLVEAIVYASLLDSHRVASDAPLVRAGADRAVVGLDLRRDDRSVSIELEINPGKANRARINRAAATRARDVIGIARTVMFAPEDLALVKGDPGDRRSFLDEVLVQRTPRLAGVRSDYDRILKQRNALLKSALAARRTSIDDVFRTLEVWDDQLATAGGEIVAARVGLLTELAPFLAQTYSLIAGGSDAVSSPDAAAVYVSAVSEQPDGLGTDREAWREQLLTGMEQRRKDELDRGLTLVGPHRDDVALHIGPLPAKGYASHGESWSLALALRLASLAVMRQDGDDPILILDDVFAELDAARRERLAAQIADVTQVFITAAVGEDVPQKLAGSRLQVTRGHVE
jgi:DNA replication and repair protein RecF